MHGHQFYRTTLQGLFSLDLSSAGTFTNQFRSGFQNLGKEANDKAEGIGLEKIEKIKAYRLPIDTRIRRIQLLLHALGRMEGGAKQTLHYTDVSPAFVMAAVTRGGNHIFGRIITTSREGHPTINESALQYVSDVFSEDLLSGVYVGRTAGFMDDAQGTLDKFGLTTNHPREALDTLAGDLAKHLEWLE